MLHLPAALVRPMSLRVLAASGAAPEPMKLVGDTNAERQGMGRAPLWIHEKLNLVAEQRANDMVKRNYFGHIQSDGRTPFDLMAEDGCSFRYAGENIATAEDERAVMEALWNSEGHRENTLNAKYRKVGVAIAIQSGRVQVFVEDFSD